MSHPTEIAPSQSADSANRDQPKPENAIRIRGARQHNLKNIDLELPRDRSIIFTGVSGSVQCSSQERANTAITIEVEVLENYLWY